MFLQPIAIPGGVFVNQLDNATSGEAHVDDVSVTSAEWAQQIKENEDAEVWDQSFEKIPIELQAKFEPFLGGMMAGKRIKVYEMIDKLDWDLQNCEQLYVALKCCTAKLQDPMIDLLWELDILPALQHAIRLLPRMSTEVLSELLEQVDRSYMASVFMNITRFLSQHELGIFISLSDYLGLQEVLKMLEAVKEPFADKCRLCRKRKLYDLHLRLENRQVPEGHYEVVGVVPLYDKAQRWAADDEKGFRFDTDTGTCYWEREVVDLVRICDNCLHDVFAAASCCTRFEHLYHYNPRERKELMTAQRAKERRTAVLFGKIFITSVWRRLKEFSIRSIRTARHGLRLEADERLRLETLEKLRLAKEKAERERAEMLAKAQSVDSKWKAEDRRATSINFKRHMDFIDLKTHIGFSRDNPVSTQREHPHSWQLQHRDAKGLPITSEAASMRFGLGVIEPQADYGQLNSWKVETITNHNAWEADQRRIKQEEAFAKHVHCDELKQYVDQRIKQLNRSYMRFQLTMECVEENRIAKRQAERNRRRDVRIAGYEANERELMSAEDAYSNKRRFFEKETANMLREQREMCQEYRSQTSRQDRFWGLDFAEQKRLEMERRLHALWEAKVEELREKCIHVRITRPFADEVRHKVFRDRITHQVIK